MSEKLRIAFMHPDLGIGGAERLVVDAALGLQRLGHVVDIFTSHHDPSHCFEETRDGTLRIHHVRSPFPRSFRGKFHILFAHLRQLYLTIHLFLTRAAATYDVYFVDQLSTCIPFLRHFAKKRVVFYCHFPDKLLADGEFVGGTVRRRDAGFLKWLYRMPMDLLEELTTGQADVLLANSEFTAGVFNAFFSITRIPRVVYPGINLSAYEPPSKLQLEDKDVQDVVSNRPTLLSLNRFEKKKNLALALKAFAVVRRNMVSGRDHESLRLVLAGGYDHRLQDNTENLKNLLQVSKDEGLRYWLTTPSHPPPPDLPASTASSPSSANVVFLLNFTTLQRSALLTSPSTLALLYTPTNEHFGIGPVEGMACGLPILACNSGGPTESVVIEPPQARTGWLIQPDSEEWAKTLETIISLGASDRVELGKRAQARARDRFGMEAMALDIQEALRDAVNMGKVRTTSLLSDVMLAFALFVLAYITYGVIA